MTQMFDDDYDISLISPSEERWHRQNWSVEDFNYDTDEYGFDDYDAAEESYLSYEPPEAAYGTFESDDYDLEYEAAQIEEQEAYLQYEQYEALRRDARSAANYAHFEAYNRVSLHQDLRVAADLAFQGGGTWHPAVVAVAARVLLVWANEVDPSGVAAALESTKIDTADQESVSISLTDLLRALVKSTNRHQPIESSAMPSIDVGALDMLATAPDRFGFEVSQLLEGPMTWIADVKEPAGRRRILTVSGEDPRAAFGNLIRKHFCGTPRRPDYADSTCAYVAGSDEHAEIVVFRAISPDAYDDGPWDY